MFSINKTAIVGGGISGLACANILRDKKCEYTLYEKKQILGGLISCSIEQGNLFHRVGGHVFNSKDKIVSQWFWKIFNKNKEFVRAKRNAVIFINGKFLNYPIELNLDQLEPSLGKKVVDELIELSTINNEENIYSFEEFLKNNFGESLYNFYFKKYNKKIWNRDLNKIPISWLNEKLPMIKPQDILLKNIYSSKDDNMVHSTFFYPKKGGSQFIVDKLSENINKVNEEIFEISIKANYLYLNQKTTPFSSLIYTGDVRLLSRILNPNIIEEINFLDSNPTSTAFCECDINKYSWIYLPSEDLKSHRMIMTGNFSNLNNSFKLKKGRITCTIECSGELNAELFSQELKKMPFNPKLIAYNFCERSYIIQNYKTRILIEKLKKKLKIRNIFLCGRFAEWEYFNMDTAIKSAMKITQVLQLKK